MHSLSSFEPAELQTIVDKIIQETLRRQIASVTFHATQGNTNELIHIHLEHSDTAASTRQLKPGCVLLETQTSEVILKFQSPDAGLDESVRLVNEVAALDLARRALDTFDVVPSVFGYGKLEHESRVISWMIQEFMPGEVLGGAWNELSLSDKETLLPQIAEIYAALQKCALPSTVESFGGLQYNGTGALISGPIVFGYGGPYASLEEMYISMFKKQLELADLCPIVKGWSGSKKGLRASLERFTNEGISSCFAGVSNKTPTLIHGDFDVHNLLIDKSSMKITALLDFDFAHIASPIDEYMYSFQSMSSILVGAHEKGDMGKLQKFILSGEQPAKLPPNSRFADWNVAVTWNEAIKTAGGIRPSDVKCADVLAELKWFMEDIRPPYFGMPKWVAKRSPEQIETERKRVQEMLEKRLKRLGHPVGKKVA